MKHAGFVLAVTFLGSSVASGQSAPAPQPAPSGSVFPGAWTAPLGTPDSSLNESPVFRDPAMQARYSTVRSYMRLPSPLAFGNEYLSMLGDQAAFFIYTVMINRPPLSAVETLTALDIIHKSFRNLLAVQAGDRKPTSSLALLKLFQATAVDQRVKERIAAENNFLNALPENVVPLPLGVPGPPPAPGTTPFF